MITLSGFYENLNLKSYRVNLIQSNTFAHLVQLPCPAGRSTRHGDNEGGPPPAPNNTIASVGGTMIVSAAVEGDMNHINDSNDIIAVGKALSSGHQNNKSSSGKCSANSMIGQNGNGNYDAKSGSYNYMTTVSPTTEATNATSGFCHSRSTGVLGISSGLKWNGVGTGSEGGMVRQESSPTGITKKLVFFNQYNFFFYFYGPIF